MEAVLVKSPGLSNSQECLGQTVPGLSNSQECQGQTVSLDTLPAELFLHICSFLKAKLVIRTLSQVCRLFRDLIQDETFWKVRMKKRWNKKYPPIPVYEKDFNWKMACIAREDEWDRWTHLDQTTTYFRFTYGLFASVDAVHLMQEGRMLATGSRDRNLNVIDLKGLDSDVPSSVDHCPLTVKMGAHKGWIWSFSSLDNTLVSGSWDTYIKFWDMNAGVQELRAAKCKSAVLCCHLESDILFVGAFDKKVYHFDPRAPQVLHEKTYHTQPVLCLAANQKYLVTGSEDDTVAVYDRQAGKLFKTVKMNSYPMSLWMGQDQLWVGDRKGKLNLFDTTDGDFNLVQTYEVGHQSRVSGVIYTMGAIFTCSSDKETNGIRVLEPTLNPESLATLHQPSNPPIAQIDYQNEVLVSANSDVSVGIWIPKSEH